MDTSHAHGEVGTFCHFVHIKFVVVPNHSVNIPGPASLGSTVFIFFFLGAPLLSPPQGVAGHLSGCDHRCTYYKAREGRGSPQKQAWMGCGGPGQLADPDSGFLQCEAVWDLLCLSRLWVQ